MEIRIRTAVVEDAPALAELAAQTFRDTFARDNEPANLALHLARAYGAKQQAEELADPRVVTLLATAKERLIGYAQLRQASPPPCVKDGSAVELWRFYVDRELHGRGVAQRLMQRVEQEARRLGARAVWLGVWERNLRALAFYRKCGFVDVGSHVFLMGQEAQQDRIGLKLLSGDAAEE